MEVERVQVGVEVGVRVGVGTTNPSNCSRGLGGSSTLAVLLCLALSTWVAAGPTPAVVIDTAELLQSTL